MKILVTNSGSSLLKFQVTGSETEGVLTKGLCERIGIDGRFTYRTDTSTSLKKRTAMENHTQAVYIILGTLTDPEQGVISKSGEIDVVEHRLVRGGEKFTGSVVITQEVIQTMTECNNLAPLYNSANLVGAEAYRTLTPDTLMVGVFDMAFSRTMELRALLYGLPYQYYEKHKVRRYGFHGISHRYVSRRAARLMGQDPGRVKTIVYHLDDGASICAVKYGQVVDNFMGLTLLEGLMTGTRYGDVDPDALEFLSKKEGLDLRQITTVLNQESGALGISKNFSSDSREPKDTEIKYHEKAVLTREIFTYKMARYVGSYATAMNGVDSIVFTVGIEEDDSDIREEICSCPEYLGIAIDELKNQEEGKAVRTPDASSEVSVLVIKTNEEPEIAREATTVVKGLKRRPKKVGKGS